MQIVEKIICGLVSMTLQSKTLQVSLQWLWLLQEKRSLPFLAQWPCNSL